MSIILPESQGNGKSDEMRTKAVKEFTGQEGVFYLRSVGSGTLSSTRVPWAEGE